MIESIAAAVRGAELAHRDTGQEPVVYVKNGEYRWQDTIVLVEKYEVDILQIQLFPERTMSHV